MAGAVGEDGDGGEGQAPLEDPEYPGVRWVLANYILLFLEDGKPMPRCQDLPSKAFGSLRQATRIFAVTHPWLGRWHPDPNGIQMETLRAKLNKAKKQLMLDETDVFFFDYLSLPQVSATGKDDRTPEEKRRLAAALSGDLMGRIYLTARVIIIDEVPGDAESSRPYLERGWCYFECIVASMNTFPRDLMWVTKEVKDQIAGFRGMSTQFRESGDMAPILDAFDRAIAAKAFAAEGDRAVVRNFLVSLATSQRLVAAASRGDVDGVDAALQDGADPSSRNGQGRTALHAACANNRVDVVVAILRRSGRDVASMLSMENETCVDLAREGGARECEVLVRHKLGERVPELIVRAIEGDMDAIQALVRPRPSAAPIASGVVEVKAKAAPAPAVAKGRASPSPKAAAPGLRHSGSGAGLANATAQAPAARAGARAAPAKAGAQRGAAMRTAGGLVLSAPGPAAARAAAAAAPRGSTPAAEPVATPSEVVAAPPPCLGARDDAGNTALHCAVSLGRVEVVTALLAARADAGIANNDEETALALAKRLGNNKVLACLCPEG